MKKNFIITVLLILNLTSSNSADFIKEKANQKVNQKVNELAAHASEDIASYTQEAFGSIKYLDFNVNIQEHLKPSFNIMSVTEILKIKSGTVFNQTSLNIHDSDETINIGLGVRQLLNENKILMGYNFFYDQQFNEGHERVGFGTELVSSIFDIRGNSYKALSNGFRTTSEGSEKVLDGWDTQVDFHLPFNIDIFANAFKFKNPDKDSTYVEKGNKYGVNASLGNFIFEGGYLDDNKKNDGYFGNIKFVLRLGNNKEKKKQSFLKFEDVSDKLYQPVKRENKIRVVKISKSGVKVGGF